MDYKNAGVDIEAGYKSVELMKEHVKKTMREEVLGGLGGFSGAFSLAKIKEMEEPVLLSGKNLDGMDAVFSIMQMPPGVPVATVAIDGAKNAAILAAKILAASDEELLNKLKAYTAEQKEAVKAKAAKLDSIGYEAYLASK